MYYKNEKNKQCSFCKKDYKTIDVRSRYCSEKCKTEGRKKSMAKTKKRFEENNIEKFNKQGKTKSALLEYKCKNCGEKFKRYRSQVKKRGVGYCGVECKISASVGKKPTDKALIDMWSRVVKLYDNNECAYCGKKEYLNSHHIFSRSNYSTRYDINNGITLCSGHHTLSSKFSAHKTPVEFVEWIKEKRGEQWYIELRIKAKSIVKYTTEDFFQIKLNLVEIQNHFKEGWADDNY